MASQTLATTLVLQLIVVGAISLPKMEKSSQSCGYESCNKEKPGMINVHLVPHTHDDVGWIVSVDEYYYRQVQFILDGVIPVLLADVNKRFIYVEQAFFTRWYNEQDEGRQQDVKKLVNEGRLEFILGGWSMTDEAATHYSAIIDNHKLGFDFLRQTFGECARPKIGWQIDPFGHAREQTSLFAQFGFDGLFFGRLDYQDKDTRMANKTMEFVWEASPTNLGSKANLFTGVLPNGYNPPNGFCFDVTCSMWNEMIKDNKKLHDYNVDKMVEKFIETVNNQSKIYRTKHLIMTMGSDFNYVQAHMFFKEMDKLIRYVNERQSKGSQINLLYSTPSCYLKQLNEDDLVWSTKQDDFFPYADRPHTFWTGYFTSRPALKYYSRFVNNHFQAVKQLATLSGVGQDSSVAGQVQHIAEVVGIAQHHDAITGTSTQAVAYDYAQRLTEGLDSGKVVVQAAYDKLMPLVGSEAPQQVFCHQLNISICSVTVNAQKFQVTLYNPLIRPMTYAVRVPVSGSHYTVYQPDGTTTVPSDIFPLSTETKNLLPETSEANNELVFAAKVPSVGYSTYFVERSSGTGHVSKVAEHSSGTEIKGKYVSVTFDSSGVMTSLSDVQKDIKVPLTQNFFYYKAHGGKCVPDSNKQPSGAYIFRPEDNKPVNISLTTWEGTYKGSTVQEARQKFSSWLSQVIRVYNDKPYVEVEWTVGPIPFDDKVGKEVVTRYSISKWGNNGVFYTDSNGREILERKLNYRPTWKLNQTEQVAGNYFPINALISSKSGQDDLQFTVLTDRSQGGTSLNDGDLEVMVHRRLMYDDCKGVGEALNETGTDGRGLVVRGKHYLVLGKKEKAASQYRPLAQEAFLQPQITFSQEQLSPPDYVKQFRSQWTGIAAELPANVHLLTLEVITGAPPATASVENSLPLLVRLEHFYETGEDAELSKPVTFNLEKLFPFKIGGVHRLALGGNVLESDVHRLQWKTEGTLKGTESQPLRFESQFGELDITLAPMEIVTLQVDVV